MIASELKEMIKAAVMNRFKRNKGDGLRLIEPKRESMSKAGYVSPRYSESRHVEIDHKLLNSNRCVSIMPDAPETESYRVLRTQILQRAARKGGNSVMITSALPGEGKTLTAVNLAITFSRE